MSSSPSFPLLLFWSKLHWFLFLLAFTHLGVHRASCGPWHTKLFQAADMHLVLLQHSLESGHEEKEHKGQELQEEETSSMAWKMRSVICTTIWRQTPGVQQDIAAGNNSGSAAVSGQHPCQAQPSVWAVWAVSAAQQPPALQYCSTAACSAPPACVGTGLFFYCGCFLKLLLNPFFLFVNVIGFYWSWAIPRVGCRDTNFFSLSCHLSSVGKGSSSHLFPAFSFLEIFAKFKSRIELGSFLTIEKDGKGWKWRRRCGTTSTPCIGSLCFLWAVREPITQPLVLSDHLAAPPAPASPHQPTPLSIPVQTSSCWSSTDDCVGKAFLQSKLACLAHKYAYSGLKPGAQLQKYLGREKGELLITVKLLVIVQNEIKKFVLFPTEEKGD